ncbi:hypothetical protein WJX84_002792 [Apatococcus fuscideae]|uniref:Uncharacterized protein n=1 Tax=Apatococcus fuscideae TaxID=2026836 RepID=A0AAW1ST95_9CHLO
MVELPPRQQAPRCTVTVSKALGQLQVHGREQEEGRSGTLAMSRQIPPAQSSKEQWVPPRAPPKSSVQSSLKYEGAMGPLGALATMALNALLDILVMS